MCAKLNEHLVSSETNMPSVTSHGEYTMLCTMIQANAKSLKYKLIRCKPTGKCVGPNMDITTRNAITMIMAIIKKKRRKRKFMLLKIITNLRCMCARS